tara:strand:- start:75 stop:614 length:540 start_codon:yes stop_codon:yes gene_type:complete
MKLLPFLIISLILGLYLGNKFPDIDQRTDLLIHRSILTHGFIVPLIIYLTCSRIKNSILRLFLIGLNIALVIHLSFDLYPRGWYMHALIHIPFIGWTWAWVSKVWIFISMVMCGYFAVKLIKNFTQGLIAILSLLLFFIYLSPDEHRFFGPFITMIVTSLISIGVGIFRVKRDEDEVLE